MDRQVLQVGKRVLQVGKRVLRVATRVTWRVAQVLQVTMWVLRYWQLCINVLFNVRV